MVRCATLPTRPRGFIHDDNNETGSEPAFEEGALSMIKRDDNGGPIGLLEPLQDSLQAYDGGVFQDQATASATSHTFHQ